MFSLCLRAGQPGLRPPKPTPRPAQPRWLEPGLVVLAAIYLLIFFSQETGDSDMWWHLAVGRYIWQHHRLPVPDPFSYTTDMVLRGLRES